MQIPTNTRNLFADIADIPTKFDSEVFETPVASNL